MLVIGLTGGIGSGKTTVANLFAAKGAPVIDADVIAKDVTAANTPALSTIVNHFGQDILLPSGELDRKKLRRLVFDQPADRTWLEALLHPIIKTAMIDSVKKISAPYVVIVIPLLLETAPYPFIDRILVIDVAESMQIERAMARDNSVKDHIEAILKTQMPRELRTKQAHDIILNDGVIADLHSQVDRLHENYLKLAKHKK